jgi:predicted transcriptional regulator
MDIQLSTEFCGLPCRVLMNKAPPTAKADERLIDVTKHLMGVDYKALIVYEDMDPIGLITYKDIMKWLIETEDKNGLLVRDLISVPLITVDIDAPLSDALNVMKKYDINCLGVQEQRMVRGLVTEDGIKEFCELYPHYLRQCSA